MEIEAKYAILDDDTYDELERLTHIADLDITDAQLLKLRDTYLDTPDRRILNAGYACRRRRTGDQTQLTLKGLSLSTDAVHRREELETVVEGKAGFDPQAWPESAVRDRVLSMSGGATLVPLLKLRQRRLLRELRSGDGETIAEVALDSVRMGEGKRREQFAELEVELANGRPEADLAPVQAFLGQFSGLVPQPMSKFERGLALLEGESKWTIPTAQTVVATDDTVGEATRKALHPLFLKMQAHEAGTYAGEDTEALHDMRVATRRMRTILRTVKPYLERETIRPIRKGLKRTARVLGRVRDLDVFREKTAAYLKEEKLDIADLGPLAAVWNVEYARRRDEMLDYIGSNRYAEFKHDFWAVLTHKIPDLAPATHLPAAASAIIAERLDIVTDRGDVVAGSKSSLAEYHQLRIDVKRLRYALAFFQPALGPTAGDAIEELKKLQDHFGDLQDAVVAARHLRAVITYGTWEAPQQSERLWNDHNHAVPKRLSRYLRSREDETKRCIKETPQVWQSFHEAGTPALIREAIAAL